MINRLSKNRQYKVLVVEDSLPFRNMIKKILTSLQFKVLAAAHGEEAMSYFADNPDINLTIYNEKFLKENIDLFFKDKKYDYIVDAIDLVTPKLDLIEFATNSKIPIISCMGTGNKIDPAKFKVADIKKTSVCPLAKIIRKELKKRRINKLKVVYSDETPRKPSNLDGNREKTKNVGSISFVPPVAGMLLASEIIKDICEL